MLCFFRRLPKLLFLAACMLMWGIPGLTASGCAETRRDPDVRSKNAHQVRQAVYKVRTASQQQDLDVEFHAWKFIVLHHSASASGSVESIHDEHRQRRDASGKPWQGIGYHFVIGNGDGMSDGQVAATFRWEEQRGGAHAGIREFNEYGIGICLIGNFEEIGPTSAQIETVKRLVATLKQEFRIDPDRILKHGDLKATACPGRLFPFDEVANVPTAGSQLATGNTTSRFSPIEPGHKEGISNVAAIQRSKFVRRMEPDTPTNPASKP